MTESTDFEVHDMRDLEARVHVLEASLRYVRQQLAEFTREQRDWLQIVLRARNEARDIAIEFRAELRHLTTAANTKTSPEAHHATEPSRSPGDLGTPR